MMACPTQPTSNKTRLLTNVTLAALISLAVCGAQAGTILQPTSATSSMGSFSSQYLPLFAINQSALTPGYVSGVTDFDTYVASANTGLAGGGSFNTWYSSSSVIIGTFDFVLGGLFNIESFALWNDPQSGGQGVNGFTLHADDNVNFTSPTLLGSYTAVEGLGNANLAQVFTFTPTAATHVRLSILSNHGSALTTGISEAAFEVAPVPEPSTLALAGIGLLALTAMPRHRNKC
jgi:hypothetical protein